MRTLAICAAEFKALTWAAAGVEPLTAPPLTMATFQPGTLDGYDFLYLALHGLPGQPFWYGDGWGTALNAEQVATSDLRGTVVFAATCGLTDGQAPMLRVLLDAGARAVVGGAGVNYTGSTNLMGAPLLGAWFRCLLAGHVPLDLAFRLARSRLLWPWPNEVTEDTRAFQLYTREV